MDLGGAYGVGLPNRREDADSEALIKDAGKLLRGIFSNDEDEVVTMDEYQVVRTLERDPRQGRDNKKIHRDETQAGVRS